jgi:ubiquinone biosynthesis monooxygenase Coq7
MEIDRLVTGFDRALRTLSGQQMARRPTPSVSSPAASESKAGAMASLQPVADKQHAGALMRVNHTGEICAQALYDGQALTASDSAVTQHMRDAAAEETDHLAWCAERLQELDTRPSLLNPLFYAGSYLMGAAAGLAGDKVSLGFVEATEAQVCKHLDEHLAQLPEEDTRSRAILEQMRADEARHGNEAIAAGGEPFSPLTKRLMTLVAKVMTTTSYRI